MNTALNSQAVSFSVLVEEAGKLGLKVLEVLSIEEVQEALAVGASRLEAWQAAGREGEMAYMKRPASLFSNLEGIMPGTKSVVCFSLNYSSQKTAPLKPGYGQVARYAWGLDYHEVIRARLKLLMERLAQQAPSLKSRVFTDAVPILERALGAKAGLGFVGKNTMLIRPGVGSYFFCAEALLNLSVKDAPSLKPAVGKCGSCTRCLDACPTKAFDSAYNLDAKKCISYLTIEKRGEFTDKESLMLGHWVFGCDICQEVCPFNHSEMACEAEFKKDLGVGPALSLKDVLEIRSEQEFKQKFQKSPLLRPGRAGIVRNSLAVIANKSEHFLIQDMLEAYASEPLAELKGSFQQAFSRLVETATGLDKTRLEGALL